ncbi:MAG: LPS export ABC transporter periplasmic protein LptC [Spirochaetales bacterium]|nr:LPS export ABC transporter periplasmic protein LptC [Spirochaetales bacterium]MCF7939263.1 LPS export ABC transporter periplasmic protein LptC [Spirochaetales bacterium]
MKRCENRQRPKFSRSRETGPAAYLHICVPLLLAAAVLTTAACSLDYKDSRLAETADETTPDAVFSGYKHTVVEHDSPLARITASTARIYEKRNTYELEEVGYKEYNPAGEITTEGTADTADYNTESEIVELRGNLRFYSYEEEAELETEYLRWNDSEETLEGRAGEKVRLRDSDGSWAEGTGFSATAADRTVRFEGPVRGRYKNEQDGAGD